MRAVAGGATLVSGDLGGNLNINAETNIGEEAIANAAAAAAMAAAQAKTKAEEQERITANRFPKLTQVDKLYSSYDFPEFDDTVTLEQFVENYRLFACSQLKLYYTPEIIRRFVSGMAASKILILEGISGTGKTSLPYSFSRYLDYPATIVSVQPCARPDGAARYSTSSQALQRNEFLRALTRQLPQGSQLLSSSIVNLARIESISQRCYSVLKCPARRMGAGSCATACRATRSADAASCIFLRTLFVAPRTTTTPPSQSPTRSTTGRCHRAERARGRVECSCSRNAISNTSIC